MSLCGKSNPLEATERLRHMRGTECYRGLCESTNTRKSMRLPTKNADGNSKTGYLPLVLKLLLIAGENNDHLSAASVQA